MPGAYAHLTLVNHFREPQALEEKELSHEAITCVLEYFKYCELGAVSPDYPYLVVGSAEAAAWADEMHKNRCGALIGNGIQRVRGMQGEAKRKCLAWLLGLVSHVVADATIHPVIQEKVGPYEQNKTAHRECEMHQDAYIYQRLKLGDIGLSEHLDSGLRQCGESGALDMDVCDLWMGMLADTYGDRAENRAAPDPAEWHKWFCKLVDDIAEEGDKLIPLARHVATNLGLVYPAEADKNYLKDLPTPEGGPLIQYDELFDRAVANVAAAWRFVERGVFLNDKEHAAFLGDWNLDTGCDVCTGKNVFWG